MMIQCPFYILDVFAEQKYAGNQLAVILDFERSLSDEQMQAIALEMNYSETTFILSDTPRNGGYEVRIYTPTCEVPFAGHPTIGTSYIILDKILEWRKSAVTLNLKIGQIPVTAQTGSDGRRILWMNTKPPQFGRTFSPDKFAGVLNLNEADFDDRSPIQIVSTGLPFPIVPLKNMDAVKRAKCNPDGLAALMNGPDDPKAVFIFCNETENSETQIHARMFAHYYGIPEDPATGSANSCLAGYLSQYEYFGNPNIDIRVEQGIEINRPSRLYLRTEKIDNKINTHVGGKCIITATGNLR